MRPLRQSRESGFALLLVFAMAAIVAMMLYLELPRVAFEAQRGREELLIQRGEQYKRAVQLYIRRFQKYPVTLEALENTNNIRFLRRRYKDPMTGKDEWRLIHAGPGGILTDSLTQKPPAKKDDTSSSSVGTPSSEPVAPVASAVPRRRQSEMGQMPGLPGSAISGDLQPGQFNPDPQPGQPDPSAPPMPPNLPYPNFQPGQPGQPYPALQPGQPGQPVQPMFGPPVPGVPGMRFNPGDLPGVPPSAPPNAANPSPVAFTGAPVGVSPQSAPSNLADPSQPVGPGQAPVPDMIRQMLGQPRPPGGFASGGTIGGGIAGVASTLEAEGIKVYNERTKYNEWEFVYDPRKDMASPLMMQQQLPVQTAPNLPAPTGKK